MGQLYPYSTKWEKSIVVICHSYGDRAIFFGLLMTGSLHLINANEHISTYIQPLNISKDPWNNEIHTLQNWRNNCVSSLYLWR